MNGFNLLGARYADCTSEAHTCPAVQDTLSHIDLLEPYAESGNITAIEELDRQQGALKECAEGRCIGQNLTETIRTLVEVVDVLAMDPFPEDEDPAP